VEQWIVFGVHRVGVRTVFGEADSRAGVAFLAGNENVGVGKMGSGVG